MNPGKVLNRQKFMSVFHKAWVHGMAIGNVPACFRTTGVYPVDKRVPLVQLSCEASNPSCDIADFDRTFSLVSPTNSAGSEEDKYQLEDQEPLYNCVHDLWK